jgi:hypothetical protein
MALAAQAIITLSAVALREGTAWIAHVLCEHMRLAHWTFTSSMGIASFSF